jgi:hypothetical protein
LKPILKITFVSAACAAFVTGCVTNDQGQLVVDPNQVNAVVAALSPPPPPPPPATLIVEEAYQPMPNDVYISAVADRDVVIFGGDTYIWVVGPDGLRHRHFYAHGDHRADVLHRRDELHHVMMSHGGHLPDHAIAARGPGIPGHPVLGAAPAPHVAAQAKPAPAAKPVSKDVKKS